MSATTKKAKATYYYKLFRVKRSDGRVTTVSVDPVLAMRACQAMGGLKPVGKTGARRPRTDATKTAPTRTAAALCRCSSSKRWKTRCAVAPTPTPTPPTPVPWPWPEATVRACRPAP